MKAMDKTDVALIRAIGRDRDALVCQREDAMQIVRNLDAKIMAINNKALAEKFEVSHAAISQILSYDRHRGVQ